MWTVLTVMFAIGLTSALVVREWWVAWVPTILFLVYFGTSAIGGPVLYDFLMLLIFLLVPSLLGVGCGMLLHRVAGRTGPTRT